MKRRKAVPHSASFVIAHLQFVIVNHTSDNGLVMIFDVCVFFFFIQVHISAEINSAIILSAALRLHTDDLQTR